MTNLPPEKCGSLATTCRKCGAVMELPELHYRLCTLADQRDKAIADLAAANSRADGMERAGAEQAYRADQNYADYAEAVEVFAAQHDRLVALLRIVADRHEHGQPIPSREIAAALAELEKKP